MGGSLSRRETLGAAGAMMLAAAGSDAAMAERSTSVRATVARATPPRADVQIFGHRGASALRPEHTIASYAKAVADGADFIEPDLVISKDGVLIVRHENNIAETTDIAKHLEFAGRKTEKMVDGEKQVGWFVEDFTLAELKTLRAIERLPQLRPNNAAMDGHFDLVTWYEMIDFAAAESLARGRKIGLVPELKHSTYFQSIGMPLEDRFLDTLAKHWYTQHCPLVIQSFEIANLQYLRKKLGRPANTRLMQLTEGTDPALRPADVVKAGGSLTFARMMQPAGLADMARYADILAPDTRTIIPLGPDRKLLKPSPVTADAHRAGLQVMPWTFRPENYFLAGDFQDAQGAAGFNAAGSVAEIRAYVAAGIDGFFTDDPALGRQALGTPGFAGQPL